MYIMLPILCSSKSLYVIWDHNKTVKYINQLFHNAHYSSKGICLKKNRVEKSIE